MSSVHRRAVTAVSRLLGSASVLGVLVLAALCLPGTAFASGVVPVTTTGTSAIATGAGSEIVSGTVNPSGQQTTYQVAYASSGSNWCKGVTPGGPSNYYPNQGVSLAATDDLAHNVSVTVSGLTPGDTYCAAIEASNSAGATSVDETGNTPVQFIAGAPTATTGTATPGGPQDATVSGEVTAAGQSTDYFVEYAIDSSAWCSDPTGHLPTGQTAAVTLPYQDALSHNVSVDIASSSPTVALQPGATYCAAIVAQNATKTSVITPSASFTTDAAATTSTFVSTSATSAEVSGQVDPDGASTTYGVAYAQVGSNWCQNLGGSPTYTTQPLQTLGAQDESEHDVTVDLSGLNSGETYCAALVTDNTPLGTSYGARLQLTVGLPTATTSTAAADSPTTAEVDGTVDPSGQMTQYQVLYDQAGSNWCLSQGGQGSATYATAPQTLPQTEDGQYDVSVQIPANANLIPGDSYCAAISAVNSSDGQNGSPASVVGLPTAADFTAGVAPGAGTAQVTSQSASTSFVSGTVNPEDQGSTTFQIGYANSDTEWCTSQGQNGTPQTTTAASVGAADANDDPVSATVNGLQAGVSYCAAILASNASGSVTGTQVQFTSGLPAATASVQGPASPTSEIVTGTVTPTTQSTTYEVAYDTASSSWCQTDGSDPAAAGFHVLGSSTLPADDADHAVAVTIGGLAPGEDYCAELVASNPSGVSLPSLQTFTAGYSFTTSTSDINTLTENSVTLDGTVDPAGLPTSYWIAYDLAGSTWCSSGGASGLPGEATAPVGLGVANTSDDAVTPSVTGLTPNTAYCAEIEAANDMGTSLGGVIAFTTTSTDVPVPGQSPSPAGGSPAGGSGVGSTTAAPSGPSATATSAPGRPSQVATRRASASSPTDATVIATVDADGESTTVHAAYATASSGYCVSSGRRGQARTSRATVIPASASGARTVDISLSRLTAGTRYCVRIVAVNASGSTDSVPHLFTTIGAPDVSDLRLAHTAFVAVSGPGTRVSYRDSQSGRIAITITRPPSTGSCQGRTGDARQRCETGPTVEQLTHTTDSGSHSFAFTGREGSRTLSPGRYELRLVAGDRWHLTSATSVVDFTIAAPSRARSTARHPGVPVLSPFAIASRAAAARRR